MEQKSNDNVDFQSSLTICLRNLKQNKIIINAIFIFGYVLIVATQYIYEDALFKWSTDTAIPAIQSVIVPGTFQWDAWHAFTDKIAGGKLQILYIVYRCFVKTEHSESVFVTIAFVLEMFWMTGLKNMHHSPRPFWDNYYSGKPGDGKGIYPGECPSQFGNPSGHSICAAYFSMYIFFAYIYRNDLDQINRPLNYSQMDLESQRPGQMQKQGQEMSPIQSHPISQGSSVDPTKKKRRIVMPLAAFIVLTLGYLAVGFSRLVMGVHSLNQIIYGFLIGFWTLAYVFNFWRPVIKAQVEKMQLRQIEQKDALRLSIYVCLFCIAQVAVLSTVYLQVMNSYRMPEKYQQNLKKCNPSFDETRLALENLFVVGISMLPAGVYCGLYRRYYVLEDRPVADRTWMGLLKKLLFSIIVLAPTLTVLALCYVFKKKMNHIVNMVIGCALPSFSLGLSIYGGFIEQLMAKCSS